MKTFLVVTITCPDRPGIVERITNVIVANGGNWEESRMAILGGDFAGIVKISAPQERADELDKALRMLGDDQMTVVVKVTEPGHGEPHGERSLFRLRLSGADHEGIVHDVAAYLARHGINVETMETEVVPAPISASPLFQMEAELNVPAGVPREDLQTSMNRLGDELGVDIEINSRES